MLPFYELPTFDFSGGWKERNDKVDPLNLYIYYCVHVGVGVYRHVNKYYSYERSNIFSLIGMYLKSNRRAWSSSTLISLYCNPDSVVTIGTFSDRTFQILA